MAKNNVDVYQEVTDHITNSLEKGVIPWRQPFSYSTGIQRNFSSKTAYRGINQIILSVSPYDSPWWLTYKQAAKLAYDQWLKRHERKDSDESKEAYAQADDRGGVRRGERSTLVVFWKPITVDEDKDGKKIKKTIPLLRYYRVFNVEQTEGIDYPQPEAKLDFDPIEAASRIIEEMPNSPTITHGGGRAAYLPPVDEIQLPKRENFHTEEGYYATAFHEVVHATGHESRINRPEVMASKEFGDNDYSKEELVAEMGAAMLCGVAEISPHVVENQAAYISHWLKRLKQDKKLLVQAAGQAQRAADFILNEEREYAS